MKKRILSFVIILVMAIGFLPTISVANAATYGDFTYEISNGEVTITEYVGDDTEVEIPSTIEGYPVTSIGYGAFYENGLTSITIPDSVTSIGEEAFYGCESLTSVTIPDSVTSIGYSAFEGCSNLESITIPDSVTSIGWGAFYGTAYYNDEQNWQEEVLYIGNHLIAATEYISSDYFMKLNTLTIADEAFCGCDSLTSITIPDSVTSIGEYAFMNCSNIQRVYITDISTWCKIDFEYDSIYENYNSNPLSEGADLYLNGNIVENLVIPTDISSINNRAFYGCESLTSVTIPDSVTSIGDRAFYGCNSLTSVKLGDSVTSIGDYAFSNCSNIEKVYITDVSAWCKIDFKTSGSNPLCNGSDLYLNGNKVKKLTITNDITSIDDYVFYNCDSLESVTIGDGVTSIGNSAFSYCYSLESITIPDSVTSIGNSAFYECTSLTSITIPDSVTSIGSCAFYECTSLTSITIPDSVTSIGSDAFSYCYSLESITIPDSVTLIDDYAFMSCYSLESITIGKGVETIGYEAFDECTALKNVYISDIKAWCSIEFCVNYWDQQYTCNPLYLGADLYLNGIKVVDLVIPHGVTTITDYAFYNYQQLKTLTLPKSISYIGYCAFYECPLTDIYYAGTEYAYEVIANDSYAPYVDNMHYKYIYNPPVTNSTTGETYASLTEALNTAKSGETIKLNGNVTENTVTIAPGVAVDLGGFELTANFVLGLNESNIYDSNTSSKGKIYVAKNNVTFSKDNTQLPVYDAQNGCYQFLKINLARANKFVYSNGAYTAEPVFGDSATIAKGIAKTLFSQGAAKSGVNVRIRVSWVDKNDTYTATQDYTFKDSEVNKVVSSFTGSKYTTIFGATFSEAVLTQGDSIEISTIVDSDTGVELSSGKIKIITAQF